MSNLWENAICNECALKYAKYAKHVNKIAICRICTPHFADDASIPSPKLCSGRQVSAEPWTRKNLKLRPPFGYDSDNGSESWSWWPRAGMPVNSQACQPDPGTARNPLEARIDSTCVHRIFVLQLFSLHSMKDPCKQTLLTGRRPTLWCTKYRDHVTVHGICCWT